MKIFCLFKGILITLALIGTARAEDSLVPLTSTKLLGSWRGGDPNELNCILVFKDKQARIHTFRADKHLSTVLAWYTIQSGEGRVTLGINGEATALPNGRLQLKLTRQYDHIVVLREATLQRMPEPESKQSLK